MLILETLAKFNWIDLVILLLFLRMCFIGLRTGLITELFKIFGLILAIYVSLHYFSQAGSFLNNLAPFLGMEISDFFCFVILAGLSYATVVIIRGTFARMVKVEAVNMLDRWGGLTLGFCRSFLLISMIFIILYLSNIIYFVESIKKSHLGSRLVYSDVRVYEFIHNRIVRRLVPDSQLNQDLYDVLGKEEARGSL